jgi:hypothetical protein
MLLHFNTSETLAVQGLGKQITIKHSNYHNIFMIFYDFD